MKNRGELAECLRRWLQTWMEGAEAKALSSPIQRFFRELAAHTSDDELITAHLLCESCGEQLITKEVDVILDELRPSSVDQFFDIVSKYKHH